MSNSIANKDISRIFKVLGKLMEINGENDFKTRSYAIAAYNIDQMDRQLAEMDSKDIASLKGIGAAISTKIEEIKATGALSLLNSYLEKTPQGLLELLSLKGMGGKKIGMLWRELGITTLDELVQACEEGRVAGLKGFGKKTEASILKAIEYYRQNQKKWMYASLEHEAEQLLELLQEALPDTQISTTGELRRRNIILDKLEYIIAEDNPKVIAAVEQLPFMSLDGNNEKVLKGSTLVGTPVVIYFSPKALFTYNLFRTTGNEEHVKAIAVKEEAFPSESDIYAKAGLKYIEPELRENQIEIELAKSGHLPELVEEEDIKGMLHSHSTYSDGVNSLEEMARGCIEMGYEYMGITDHSKSAFYAGGLLPDTVKRQHEEIDRLNELLAPFKIFKGIESDILIDGSLDYDEDILASFDLVIVSIHGNMKMTEEKATERLIRAAMNPYTSIMGHPSGRLLLRRDAYPVDFKKLIDVCAEYNTAIEINANPRRLDMDWKWIPYAMSKNLKIAINPDAHSIEGINDIHYGTLAARKGGLTKKFLLNQLGRDEFEQYLKDQRTYKLSL